MSLIRIDDSGATYPVSAIPLYDLYAKYKKEWPQNFQAITYSYIEEKIHETSKFSIATRFPKLWDKELEYIFEFCHDETLAAFILAYIVMEQLIRDEKRWLCTKTNIQDRDFESNFYWR